MTGETGTARRPQPRPSADAARLPRQRDSSAVAQLRLLAAVGTDKHRFDRLVDWLAQWHAQATGPITLTVQHGHTNAPQLPGAVPFLGHDALQQAMIDADLVVCHGGPATILEARRHGHLPIVVPRDPARGEHVDNHQLLFARRLGAAGLVALCETREALHEALTAGAADPSRYAVAADPDAHEARRAAVARVGQIVDDLVTRSTPRPPRWRVWSRPRPGTEEIR
ncbi:UDP-N-acetylglucosamine transferase subunit ALG13 [Micromonospora violae]|uniref:UDP-N-acetylglucosamine transferase subunit ALG13 n=1 Tax=Micromonospora violae TaxID=1278207 RepID=A0A4Q7U9N3_9ACTN|nr:glycosyltransferase [Micromonospora violae]RZT77705.1 UDP-N-acetylglucosamine transferase subunit ALG13 [Micromonospora violae]